MNKMDSHKVILLLIMAFIKRSMSACDEGLGMDADNRKIPNSSITASSEAPFLRARFGRLNEKYMPAERNYGGWCAYECTGDQVHYLQVDLGKAMTVTGVETQSVYHHNNWVKSYTLSYSYDKISWYDYKVGSKGKTFKGNDNRYDPVRNQIDPPLTARYIRIMPRTFTGQCPCLRAEVYGCKPAQDCRSAIGIDAKIRSIPDKSMTASSEYNRHFAYEGRLNNVHRVSSTGERSWGAWCPKKTDVSPYLQIDLGRVRVVSGVATQGYSFNLWTTQYHLNYSIDGTVWRRYMESGVVKLFTGNSDNNTIRTQMLDPKTETIARFVRIIPVRWNNYPNDMACLRVEVYQCAPIKGSVPIIKKGIENIIVKRGTTFNLTCMLTGQVGMEVTWQKNGNPLSTTDVISISNSIKDTLFITSLHFRKITMAENANTFSCTANYPSVTVKAASTAQVTVDGSIPVLHIVKVGVYTVDIALGVAGSVVSDIVAYEVTLVDFATSEKITAQFAFNSTDQVKRISKLKPFTKYNINVRFYYLDGTKGARIPDRQFRTRECRPQKAPTGISVTKLTAEMLEIHWKKPNNDPCTVEVVAYDVSVVIFDKSRSEYTYVRNRTKMPSFNVTELKAKSEYNVTVRARTVAGPGPFSSPYIITFTPAQMRTNKPTSPAATSTSVASTEAKKTTVIPKTKAAQSLKLFEELEKIKMAGITNSNVVNVTEKVEQLTNQSSMLDSKDISITADILEQVVKVNGTTAEIGDALVKTVSNVLNANSSVLEESHQLNNTGIRYVKILENWLEKVKIKGSEMKETSENIIVKKIKIVQGRIRKGVTFEESEGTSVTIPVEALVDNDNSTNYENESLYFVYYKRNKFFTRKTKESVSCENGFTVEEKTVYTPVLASSIVGREVRNLSKPITLTFKKKPERQVIEKAACVYWDFTAKGGLGDWSTYGCRLQEIVNDTIVCECDHMTNFAAMMDVYAHTSKACGKHGRALSYISVVGCFLSLIGLFFTMVTYIIFRRLRREVAARIMLQLCISLFVVVVLFLTGLERTGEPKTCLAIGILLHYFTLTAFMWMFMEAAFMYHAFVVVWPPREENDVLKCTLIAWGLPAIIVAATAASDLGHYQGQHYCRVNGLPFYIGFLAPICLILVVNLVIFGIIMYKLSTRPTRSVEKNNKSEATQRLRRAFGIMILMGLTWIFGAIAVEDFRLVFQYLFAVCNSLQGFAIFVFYCLSQKNVRDTWMAFLKCDGSNSLKLRTESYSDRRRFSSSASQKSSVLLPRTRANSSTVMMRNDSAKNRALEGQRMLDEQVKMQTIQEMDAEDSFVDKLTSNIYVDSPEESQPRADPHISVSSSEDDAGRTGSQTALQPYRSYRGLSEIKELNNLLSLADKRKSSSKSNEALIRKSLVLNGSSPLLPTKDRMRTARSCENMAKPRSSTEMDDFAVMRANQPRILIQSAATRKKKGSSDTPPLINLGSSGSEYSKSQESCRIKDGNSSSRLDGTPHGSTYKIPFDSPNNTLDSNSHSLPQDGNSHCSTLRSSKASSVSESSTLRNDEATTCVPRGYEFQEGSLTGEDRHVPAEYFREGTRKSHEDVMEWLHGAAEDAQSVSSMEYRSSMCSSDMPNSDLPSCRSSLSSTTTGSGKYGRKQSYPFDQTGAEPLRDALQNTDDSGTEASSRIYRPMGNTERDRELSSDGGYSASEEEGSVSDRQALTRSRKRTKSKNGSLGTPNGLHRSAYV